MRCHKDSVFIHALTCAITPEWSTYTYPGAQYSPLVVTQVGLPLAGVPSVWALTYNSTELDPAPTGVTMSFMNAHFGVTASGTRLVLFPTAQDVNIPICPDLRGYWGDYDDLQILNTDRNGTTTFIRAHSTTGLRAPCASRDQFTENPLHVDGLTFQ